MAGRAFGTAQPGCGDGTSVRDLTQGLRAPLQKATGYSPIAYVQLLRIEEAKRRLEQTAAPVDQIAWDVGYQDAAAFRRLFKRVARVTPGSYRRKFTAPASA